MKSFLNMMEKMSERSDRIKLRRTHVKRSEVRELKNYDKWLKLNTYKEFRPAQ